MSGIIAISEDDKFWGGATWAYDEIINRIRNNLPQDAPETVRQMLEAGLHEPRIIFLYELSPPDIKIFIEALKSAFEQVEAEGECAFEFPEYFPSWLASFQKLVRIVCEHYEKS